MDLTTYLGPNPQVYRKVPIINPVHRFLALQHYWRPERFMKLAVGGSGGVLPPHSHYKQRQYSHFLRLVVAYGDGYSVPPIPGAGGGQEWVRRGSGGVQEGIRRDEHQLHPQVTNEK